MKKFFKFVGAALTLLVIVAVSLLIAVPWLVDPNDYREPIEDLVTDRTGRQLSIDGDLELSVFPWLGLKTGAVRLANAEGFGDQPFASVDSAEARVRVLPLIGGDIRVGTLAVSGATLHLARDAQGRDNWSGLVERLTETAAGQGETGTGEGSPAAVLSGLTIDEMRVTDTRIRLRDAAAGARYHLDDGRLEASGIAFGEPFPVELEGELQGDAPPARVGALVTGKLTLNPAEERYGVSDLRLAGDVGGKAVPGGEQAIEIHAEGSVDLGEARAKLDDVAAKAAGMSLAGRLELTELSGTPALDGRMKIAEFSPRRVLDELAIDAPETADPDVMRGAAFETDLGGTVARPELAALLLRLDDTQIKGTLRADTTGRVPAVSGELAVTDLNVDRYLPPQQADAGGSPGTAAGALPFEMLRAVDLDLAITAQQLMGGGLKLVNMVAEIELEGGRLRIHPLEAGLYGGVYRGDLRIDARPDRTPSVAVSEELVGVSLGPLVEALMDRRYITGKTNAVAELTASGSSAEALTRSLSGRVRFEAADGKIYGVDLLRRVRNSYDRIQGNRLSAARGEKVTDYSWISGSANIAEGVAVNRDMTAKSPLIEATGGGSVDLVEETIDYTTLVTLRDTDSGTADEIVGRLEGTPIPVRIQGALANPSIRPDVRAALQGRAGQKIQEKVEDLGEKIEDKAEEKLEGLFD